jgi:hypothetical protein
MSDPAVRYRQREGVLAQEAHGQTVLLRVSDGGYYALDEVSARVWALCDGERSLAEVVEVICGEYEAPAAEVDADVQAFVADLVEEDLLVPHP